jgi:PPP family 3-phenylpropionic acid transporter
LADALALGAAERLDATGCRAFDYGWVRGAGSAAFIAGSILSGQVIGRFGLTAIVVLQAGLFAVACLFAFRVPEQRLPTAYDIPSPSSSAGSAHGIRLLLAIPLYRRIVLVTASSSAVTRCMTASRSSAGGGRGSAPNRSACSGPSRSRPK